MLIDRYLHTYSFSERHSIIINCSIRELYPKVLKTNFSQSAWIRFLFKLRGMPSHSVTVDKMESLGFIRLAEEPPVEIVLGIATRSWMFNGCLLSVSPYEFLQLNGKGLIKAVINFYLKEISNASTLLTTETRVFCGDRNMKWKFSIYWFFISPFSKLIRRLMLLQIKKGCIPT
ncbi:MAG: hypothetical protein ICV53_04540 [Flavisolibacter sp.]|nr:hypothetical protein [Flavisolibacter sp.]